MRLIGPYMTRYATLGYASINEFFKFVNLFYPGKTKLICFEIEAGQGDWLPVNFYYSLDHGLWPSSW